MTALECYDRPVGGRRYLRADLSVPCFEGQHAAVAVGAGALLAVLGVGFPVGLVLALRGGKPAPSLRFLFEGFDEERGLRWWEALGLLRKMGLVMAAALVPDAASQVAAAVLVLAPALWAQTRFHPYRASKFNALETMSILAMMLTATVSLLYLQAQGGEAAVQEQTEAHLSGWTEVAVTLVLVGANAGVFALMLFELARAGQSRRGAPKPCWTLSRSSCARRTRCRCCERETLPETPSGPKLAGGAGVTERAGAAGASGKNQRDKPRQQLKLAPARRRWSIKAILED